MCIVYEQYLICVHIWQYLNQPKKKSKGHLEQVFSLQVCLYG